MLEIRSGEGAMTEITSLPSCPPPFESSPLEVPRPGAIRRPPGAFRRNSPHSEHEHGNAAVGAGRTR